MNTSLINKIFIPVFLGIILLTCTTPSDKPKQGSFPAAYLEEITIVQLQEGYRTGKFSVKQVVSDYLARIEAIDRNGPCLNSVIMVNPDALTIADSLDKVLASGHSLPPLFGVPVLLKDNIDTHDRMPCTAGSRALGNSYPAKDSPVAAKLRESGAVILGKANLSEWANFRGENSTSGWSGLGGQTKNPYVLDRNPCGSSSGSGVAVSANLCMAAIGTETNGSIVCPSNNNGIVGIKPTVGLISRSGIIPISFTQDTPGPMTRTVEDAVKLLGTLTGIDPDDPKTMASEGKSLTDYTHYLKKDGLKGKRIGLVTELMGFHFKVDTVIMSAVKAMKSLGAEIIEVKSPARGYNSASMQVMLYEFKDGLNRYLSRLDSSVPHRSLKDLIEFNRRDTVELRYFDQKIFEQAQEKGSLDSKEYRDALERMLKATRDDGIDKLLREHKLDALMAPTGSPAWKTDLILGDHYMGGSSSLAAISGYPSITVPAGFIDELPVGVSFFGNAWSEPVLIEIAYAFEQGTKHRRVPKYLPTD